MRAARRGRRGAARIATALACALTAELVGPSGVAGASALHAPVAAQVPRATVAAREDTYTSSSPADVGRWTMTPEGSDAYSLALGTRTVRATAPATNVGGDLRMAWWPSQAPPSVDSEACVTMTRWGGPRGGPVVQPGVALRVRQDGGRKRAVSVTNNVYYGARWAWNVHLWDAVGSARSAIRQVGSVHLTQVFGNHPRKLPPLPWRLCARVVGTTVQLKAWPTSRGAEPAWGDPSYGGTAKVPADWVFPGRSGWYIGHLLPRDWSESDELGSWALHDTPGEEYGVAVEAWAGGLYPLLFDRPADDGRAYWADQAMARSGAWVVSTMGQTVEARRKTVTDVYQRVLRRAPDPAGRDFWAGQLLVRPNVEALTLAVVMAPEFSGQRDDRTFVTDLYDRILDRPADPAGVDHWVSELAAGTTRERVAALFVRSSENRHRTVSAVHQEVVGRPPTASEATWWGAVFASVGLNRIRLEAAMALASLPPVPA